MADPTVSNQGQGIQENSIENRQAVPAQDPDEQTQRVHELIDQIQANRGPGGLDLSGVDYSDLDLSERALRSSSTDTDEPQVWLTSRLGHAGINLIGANLAGAFLPRANLSFARMQLSNLAGADLYGANLHGADLYRASLTGAAMYKADLRDAKLERADLSGADLQLADLSGANLLRARLDGTLISRRAVGQHLIQEDAESYAVYLADDGKLHDFALAREPQPSVSREHLYTLAGRPRSPSDYEFETSRRHLQLRYLEAREIYLALKACFEQQSLTDDASWAHYRARQMQRKSYFPSEARHCYPTDWPSRLSLLSPGGWFRAAKFLTRWAVSYTFEVTCGYGERPSRAFGCIVFVFALFTGLITVWADFGRGAGSEPLMDCVLFSLGSLGSVGFNDLSPVNGLGKLLASVEGILGISFFALFMFTLGNKMGRG